MVWHYVPRERCSPEFALHWAARVGAFVGTQEFDPSWPFVCGLPKWKLRKGARLATILVKHWFVGDAQSRFDARYQFRGWCGYIKGIRLARKNHSIPGLAT